MMLATWLLLANLTSPIPVQDEEVPPHMSQTTIGLKCLPRNDLVKHIKDANGAVPLFVGMTSKQGIALEVWRDTIHPGDLWIAFLTRSDDTSCIVSQGAMMGYADPNADAPLLKDEEGHNVFRPALKPKI